MKPYSSKEAVTALLAQSGQIRTERGRAWLTMRWRDAGTKAGSKQEQKISFPAVIAVDRTNPAKPLFRLEAMDPFGTTHALMVLDEKQHFTWIDYDQRRVYEMDRTWNGIPLQSLPDLVLGMAGAVLSDGRVSSSEDGFDLKRADGLYRYLMTWIDPGPRLALKGVDGATDGAAYVVRYSHYLDKADFYLPRDVKIQGYAKGATAGVDEPTAQFEIAWRERKWNEDVPTQVFAAPKSGTQGFSRERL